MSVEVDSDVPIKIPNAENKDGSGDEDNGVSHLELHGKDERMKLSNKSPETLLKGYKDSISESLASKKYDQAIEDLIRCTALSRIAYGDQNWKYAESEAELAHAYWKHKGLAPQAQLHAEEARNIMLKVVQADPSDDDRLQIYRVLLATYITLGEAYNAQKKYTDSELSFQKAEKVMAEQEKFAKKTYVDREMTENLEKLKAELRIAQGKLAANQGKSATSITYLEEAIKIIQELYGENSLKLIPLHQMVGKVEQRRENANHMKSIESFLEAHSIANHNYSDSTAEVAGTGFEVGLAYTKAAVACDDKDQKVDAETSAESYFNECIATYQSLFGPNHEKTIKCQDELARLMIRTDRPDEAIQLLRSTIPARKDTFGEFSDNLASTYELIGSVQMSQGNMEKALKVMNKELSDAEQQYRNVQQQHLSRLQTALEEKDKELAQGQVLFDQLKRDFKYNFKLLQDRDEELAHSDIIIEELNAQISVQLSRLSELSVQFQEVSNSLDCVNKEKDESEARYRHALTKRQDEFDKKVTALERSHSQQRLEWTNELNELKKLLKVEEEARLDERREMQHILEEKMSEQENNTKFRLDELESEKLVLTLKVSSLTNELTKLREQKTVKDQCYESTVVSQKKMENELKQREWELQDQRAACNRVIQDLKNQIADITECKKTLVESYESKLIQAEARLNEMSQRHVNLVDSHNDTVNDLKSTIRKISTQSESLQRRLSQKEDQYKNEKETLIGEFSEERRRLGEKLKVLEEKSGDNSEVERLKQLLKRCNDDLSERNEDIEKYRVQVSNLESEIAEKERQQARVELECQQRCNDVQQQEHRKSETLIGQLTKSRNESQARVKKLEGEINQLKQVISTLSKDNSLENTSVLNGRGTTHAVGSSEVPTVVKLQQENDNLKVVISKMREQMESLSNQAVVSPIKSTKMSKESELKSVPEIKSTPDTEDYGDVDVGKNDKIRQVIKSLNSNIHNLRSEKVQLTTVTRKNQIEIERLTLEVKRLEEVPRKLLVDLDQTKYELNSIKRQSEISASSMQQRINDLESHLAMAQEEAAEYHRSYLNADADNQSLSNEITELKMLMARSGTDINYGAQELVIQGLQDENERLRDMIKGQSFGNDELQKMEKAAAQISQLKKEKTILTDLSNRLRSMLHQAGIDPNKPSSKIKLSSLRIREKQCVARSLAEIENTEYEQTKSSIRDLVKNKLGTLEKIQSTALPGKIHGVRNTPVSNNNDMSIPAVIEKSSSSSSSLKVKAKPVSIAPKPKAPTRAVTKIPAKTTNTKSNVPWIAQKHELSLDDAERPTKDHDDAIRNVSAPDKSSTTPVHRGADYLRESTLVGSSIQDVWDLLDDGTSFASSHPSHS